MAKKTKEALLLEQDARSHKRWVEAIARSIGLLWQRRRRYSSYYRRRNQWQRRAESSLMTGCPCRPCRAIAVKTNFDHWKITILGSGEFLFRYVYEDQEKFCDVPLDVVLREDIAKDLTIGVFDMNDLLHPKQDIVAK